MSLVHSTADKIAQSLNAVSKPLYLHEPCIEDIDKQSVLDCLDSGWVSSAGPYVEQFGKDLSEYVGAYAIPVVNGTSGLHLALKVAGVERDHEVLTPSMTFVATANAITYCGAIPHFAEVEAATLGLDPEKLRTYLEIHTKRTNDGLVNMQTGCTIRALIVAHILGFPARIDELKALCDDFGLAMIEDAAESLGSFYKGRHTGTFGQTGMISFNGNKIVTTGGGGAIITKDKARAEHIKHLSITAKSDAPYMIAHDAIGYNYRMPGINAALGCSQLKKLPQYLKQKRTLAQHYQTLFQDDPNITFMQEPESANANYWLSSVLLPDEQSRNALIDALATHNIHCRGIWEPLHRLPMYKDSPRMDLTVTEDLAQRTLNLPSSPKLADSL